MTIRVVIPLRTAVALPFVILFALTVLIQATLHNQSLDKLMQQETDQLLRQMTGTIHARLESFLATPVTAQRLVADGLMRYHTLQDADLTRSGDYILSVFRTVFAMDEHLSVIGLGTSRGDYLGIRRNDQRNGFDLMLKDNRSQHRLTIYDGLALEKVVAQIDDYDPRVRPWYRSPAEATAARWTQPYTNMDEKAQVAVSYGAPLIRDGKLLGVVATNISLDAFNVHLKHERSGLGSVIAIVDAEGRLIAQSEPGSVIRAVDDSSSVLDRIKIAESPAPLLRHAAEYIDVVPRHGGASFSLKLGEKTYFGRAIPFSNPQGIDWRILAILPDTSLLVEARKRQTVAILVACALGVTGVAIGWWSIGLIAKPIVSTAEAARQMAPGSSYPSLHHYSPVRETAMLLSAFAEMASRMQSSFNRLRELVLIDDLTGLPTRRGMLELFSSRDPMHCALYQLGLDDFRTINDVLGHACGDCILRTVAERLQAIEPRPTAVARIGGDEFAVLFSLDDSTTDVQKIGQLLLRTFDTPFLIQGDVINISASIGSEHGYLENGQLPEWLRHTSAALGEAKLRERGTHVFFDDEILSASIARGRIKQDLNQAIEHDELTLLYQPIVDLISNKVVSVEALIRWMHPEKGLLEPETFIPVAEKSDLIVRMGRFVLERACMETAAHQSHLSHPVGVHINISARQLLQTTFLDEVVTALRVSSLPPELLTLELTETLFIDSDQSTLNCLFDSLKAIGVRIAIDDFGTGYSSLSYLERLPIDCLKIDRQFITRINDPSARSAAIASTIIEVGQKLGLETVAEGIETVEQASKVCMFGCHFVQGYLYGPPTTLDRIEFIHEPEPF